MGCTAGQPAPRKQLKMLQHGLSTLGMEPRVLTAAKTGCVATWPAPWQPHRRAAVRDRRLGDLPSTREDGAFGNVLHGFYGKKADESLDDAAGRL